MITDKDLFWESFSARTLEFNWDASTSAFELKGISSQIDVRKKTTYLKHLKILGGLCMLDTASDFCLHLLYA